jgi:hypothetical protein
VEPFWSVSVHLAHCLCRLKNEVVYESGMLRMKEFPTPEALLNKLKELPMKNFQL